MPLHWDKLYIEMLYAYQTHGSRCHAEINDGGIENRTYNTANCVFQKLFICTPLRVNPDTRVYSLSWIKERIINFTLYAVRFLRHLLQRDETMCSWRVQHRFYQWLRTKLNCICFIKSIVKMLIK